MIISKKQVAIFTSIKERGVKTKKSGMGNKNKKKKITIDKCNNNNKKQPNSVLPNHKKGQKTDQPEPIRSTSDYRISLNPQYQSASRSYYSYYHL